MKYYKVTSVMKSSARAYFDGSIFYRLNEWVTPTFGKLFVFNNLETAKSFMCSSERIFECRVRNPSRIYRIPKYMKDLKDYWEGKKVKKKDAPKGTRLCDAVMLVKEIK